MKAEHTSLETFIADMERIHGKGEKAFVRAQAMSASRDEKGGVTDYRVIAGFFDGEYLYELTLDCGEFWAGGKENEAEELAKNVEFLIEEKCEQLGFEHGGGQWQLT